MSSPSAVSNAVSVTVKEGYAIVSLRKEPVNSLDLSLWQELEDVLTSLEASPLVSGLIITSGLQRDVFTAGNDLGELYAPRTTEARYTEFWITSNHFLSRLYMSRLATIAAIRGACPAGGCMMSMCCDHRVMSSIGNIGLNEVQLGIPVPKYWGLLMGKIIGPKAADKLLLTGKLISPVEAKALGMVDQVVDKGQVLEAAEKVMTQLVKVPGQAVKATKVSLREDFCNAWQQYYVEEPKGAWAFLNKPETLRTLEAALQRLSGNKGAHANGKQQASRL